MAETTVRELVTKWRIDVDMKAIDKADAAIANFKSAIKATTALAVAAGATIYGMASSVANAGDAAYKTSQALGVSVESLQELQYAAKLSGIQQDEMNSIMSRFSRVVYDARTGAKGATDAFTNLGLSSKFLSDKNVTTDRMLMAVADRFQAMPDSINKTALATEIFGRSGARLIPFLNQGSAGIDKMRAEARKLGIVLSAEAARAGEEFNDNMERARLTLIGVRNIVGTRLIPILNDLAIRFKDWVIANRELIAAKTEETIKILIQAMKGLWIIMTNVYKVIRGLSRAVGGIENAFKLLTYAALAFIAIKYVSALGNLAMALYGVATAFGIAGTAAGAANATILLIPLLIGAAIAALVLIIDDFVAFMQDRPSMIGEALKFLNKIDFGAVWTSIKDGFRDMINFLIDDTIRFGKVIWELLSGPLDRLAKWFTGGTVDLLVKMGLASRETKAPAAFAEGTVGRSLVGGGAGPVASVPIPAAGPPAAASRTSNNQFNVTSPITVNVPAGTPPETVGDSVREGVGEGLNRVIRETARAAQPVVEY